jgi:hypothetical protein
LKLGTDELLADIYNLSDYGAKVKELNVKRLSRLDDILAEAAGNLAICAVEASGSISTVALTAPNTPATASRAQITQVRLEFMKVSRHSGDLR